MKFILSPRSKPVLRAGARARPMVGQIAPRAGHRALSRRSIGPGWRAGATGPGDQRWLLRQALMSFVPPLPQAFGGLFIA
ncbi:hypothetical protein QO014_000411 [Kaistia dalseonensis]|uniref:Uncharacterized protein n=1 Tax=Kaistia dalseonensis TaxID=410840 RepID=A0ABU0H167_9HYPH|nr:hypothetical protein [Kaistia dalseonensis]